MSNGIIDFEEYWNKEIEKCKESPYYFFTTYLRVDNKPLTTFLTEREFNDLIKHWNGKQ